MPEKTYNDHINENGRVMQIARKKGYHGMFNTMDSVQEIYNHTIDMIGRYVPKNSKAGILIAVQQLVNGFAVGTAIEIDDIFKLVEEGDINKLREHMQQYMEERGDEQEPE